MIKAVIFDLDGVLADACEIHRQSLNQALKEIAGYEISANALPRYEGLPTRNKLLLLSTEGRVSHDQFDAINKRKQEITHEKLKTQIKYNTGAVTAMRNLMDKGIQIAIVTNCTSQSASIMLDQLGVSQYIRTIVTSEDVDSPKPNPEGLELAMRVLGTKSEEVIYVGDQPVDARAAHNAMIENFIHVNSPNEVTWELFSWRVSK